MSGAVSIFLSLVALFCSITSCHSQYFGACEVSDNCSSCFNILAMEVVNSSSNQYNLIRAFFPPENADPVFVIVSYQYRDADGKIDYDQNKTWYWAISSFYHFQPPEVLLYTSLFFTDPKFKFSKVNITLSMECFQASDDFMQLLTQRLKLYIGQQSAFPISPLKSDTKAESKQTFQTFIDNHKDVQNYFFSIQIMIPFFTMIASVGVIIYLKCGGDTRSLVKGTEKALFEGKCLLKDENDCDDCHCKWEVTSRLHMTNVVSSITLLYFLIMSSFALSRLYQQQEEEEFSKGGILFGVTLVILAEDSILFVLSLVLNGIYIIITCVQNADKMKEKDSRCSRCQTLFPMISIALLVIGFAVHSIPIVIGFIHSKAHASSVAIFYGLNLLSHVIMYKVLSVAFCPASTETPATNEDKDYRKRGLLFSFVFYILSVVHHGSFAYICGFYLLLPISEELDDFPLQISDFFTGIFLVTYGYLILWLLKIRK